MSEPSVHLQLSGRLTYVDDITVTQATQIISFIINSASGLDVTKTTLGSTRPMANDVPPRRRKVANPRDALDASGAKTNPERIVALAAYTLQDREIETFTLDSIRPLFRRAREATPGNLWRDLDVGIRNGWIGEGAAKGELHLTGMAENVLQTGFDEIRGKRGSRSKPRNGGSKKPRAIAKPDVFAEIDTFPTVLDGLQPYREVKLKQDRMLWAINLAKHLGVPGLQNKDIVWLTDKLGDGIVSKDISAYFRGLQRRDYVNRSTIDNAIRITHSGEVYLKSLATTGA